MSTNTDGKSTWLITGCSQGLGRAIAEEALARGHNVALTARRAESVADLATRYPAQTIVLTLDVTKGADIAHCVAATRERFGSIDILVNNAGRGLVGAVEEARPEEYRAIFDANVFALVEMTRAVLPTMREQGRGHIFNISSLAGFLGHPGVAYYCSTKFAVEGLSEGLAVELAPFGIGVTIVEPGSFSTGFRQSLHVMATELEAYAGTIASAARKRVVEQPPRSGDPARAAEVLVDLAERGEAPLRLPLGDDCVGAIEKKIAMLGESQALGKEVSRTADFYHDA